MVFTCETRHLALFMFPHTSVQVIGYAGIKYSEFTVGHNVNIETVHIYTADINKIPGQAWDMDPRSSLGRGSRVKPGMTTIVVPATEPGPLLSVIPALLLLVVPALLLLVVPALLLLVVPAKSRRSTG